MCSRQIPEPTGAFNAIYRAAIARKIFCHRPDRPVSEWLTRKQINPSRFTYSTDQIGDSVRVRVDFVSHGEADLFSNRFSGRIIA
jgi:hypothetical protein